MITKTVFLKKGRWTIIMETIKEYYEMIKEKYGLDYEPVPEAKEEEISKEIEQKK